MASFEEYHDIVIVGGGICGLATALALHRKGFRSLVLERSEILRATGAAIGVLANGWRALDQLGVGYKLRQTAIPMERACDIWIDKGRKQEYLLHEARCLKRSDLVETLADALPPGTIRFGCQVVSVKMDPRTNYPTLQLDNGNSIITKVLIGCDGSRSIVADFLELTPPKQFEIAAFRGLANYTDGHKLSHEFIRMRRGNAMMGRIPITETLVYWFVGQQLAKSNTDTAIARDPKLMKQTVIDSLEGFPSDFKELIEDSNLESLSFYHIKYRAPWELLLRQFRKGTVLVAGDAMHVMGPFLGQGGSAALEDAVVLARNLSQKISAEELHDKMSIDKVVGNAFDQYLKERRWRLLRLSLQSYLSGVLFETTSLVKRFIAVIAMISLFSRDPMGHTKFDCGLL
ncbi:hypothetical protein Leryth_017774 [Lithospermum erythrorhizon]|nr:hypothetical protein Leryth_017774 [Lithospermum erythrorhizon]